jgi:hypothetical protein
MRAVASKDPGNPHPISSFAVLQDTCSDLLLSVAKDSCVVFLSAVGTPLEVLSLLRAKELTQAELALARSKIEAQLTKEKEATEAEKLADGMRRSAWRPLCQEGLAQEPPKGLLPLRVEGEPKRWWYREQGHEPAKHGQKDWCPNAVLILEHSRVRA